MSYLITPAERRRRIAAFFRTWAPGFSSIYTVVLSTLAFAVSLAVAYYTQLISIDDVRVVIQSSPTFVLNKKGDISVSGASHLTFINVGNRQAALSGLNVLITKMDHFSDQTSNCRTKNTTNIPFDQQGFVLKPGDIVLKQPDMTLLEDVKNGGYIIPKPFFSSFYSVNPGDVFLACLSLTVVTPDSYSLAVDKPLYKYVVGTYDKPSSSMALPLFSFGKPIQVIRKSHLIFQE